MFGIFFSILLSINTVSTQPFLCQLCLPGMKEKCAFWGFSEQHVPGSAMPAPPAFTFPGQGCSTLAAHLSLPAHLFHPFLPSSPSLALTRVLWAAGALWISLRSLCSLFFPAAPPTKVLAEHLPCLNSGHPLDAGVMLSPTRLQESTSWMRIPQNTPCDGF